MTTSLVEAAARAIRDALAECREAKPPDVGTSWPDYMVAATAAMEAVGDALRLEGREAAQFEACGITDADVYAAHERGRLEGAQAERERWDHAILTVRASLHATKAANPEATVDEQEGILDWVLDELANKEGVKS